LGYHPVAPCHPTLHKRVTINYKKSRKKMKPDEAANRGETKADGPRHMRLVD
jgi:hypothetical protein